MQIAPAIALSASLGLDGPRCWSAAESPAALPAIRGLLGSGAVVTVVAPEIEARVADLAARGLLIMR
jgi:hypothetical protein